MFLRAILDCGTKTQTQGQKTKFFFVLPQKYYTMETSLSDGKSFCTANANSVKNLHGI